jgi:hypothetical protein
LVCGLAKNGVFTNFDALDAQESELAQNATLAEVCEIILARLDSGG